MGGNAAGFLPIVRAVARASRRVVVLDLPGHGRSPLGRGQAPATVLECDQGVGAALLELEEPAVLLRGALRVAFSLPPAAELPDRTAGRIALDKRLRPQPSHQLLKLM